MLLIAGTKNLSLEGAGGAENSFEFDARDNIGIYPVTKFALEPRIKLFKSRSKYYRTYPNTQHLLFLVEIYCISLAEFLANLAFIGEEMNAIVLVNHGLVGNRLRKRYVNDGALA